MSSPVIALEPSFRQFDAFFEAIGGRALEQWLERTRENADKSAGRKRGRLSEVQPLEDSDLVYPQRT